MTSTEAGNVSGVSRKRELEETNEEGESLSIGGGEGGAAEAGNEGEKVVVVESENKRVKVTNAAVAGDVAAEDLAEEGAAAVSAMEDIQVAGDNNNNQEQVEEQADDEQTGKVSLRLRVCNMGKHANKKEIVKILKNSTGPTKNYKNIKCAPKWDYCFVTFETKADLDEMNSYLKGLDYKGKVLATEVVRETARDNQRQGLSSRPIMVDDGRSPEERIADQVTPLWRTSYVDQLILKNKAVRGNLSSLKNELWKFFPKKAYDSVLPEFEAGMKSIDKVKSLDLDTRTKVQLAWLRQAAKDYSGIPCPLDEILPSPATTGYRSKCEFTFGKDLNGEKTCGFLLGLFKEGVFAVLNPKECLNVSDAGKAIANILEDYVSDSTYDVYDRISNVGFFRSALVRTLGSGQNMLMLQINPTHLTAEQIAEEKENFKTTILAKAEAVGVSIDSLYFQESNDVFNGFKDSTPSELLSGTPYIVETLFDQQFQISPTSFFQVNPTATEVLYGKIREITLAAAEEASSNLLHGGEYVFVAAGDAVIEEPTGEVESSEQVDASEKVVLAAPEAPVIEEKKAEPAGVVLLDLCCGTGTIGISMAKHVKKVIGVELTAEAIDDAKANAAANGVENITYLNEKVEDAMFGIFKNLVSKGDTVVAILDPPRSGVHASVIKSIRDCKALDHVIFVACSMKSSMQNMVDLCRPTSNKFGGFPFVPTKALSVDLFPHTEHYEVVVEFRRQKPADVGL